MGCCNIRLAVALGTVSICMLLVVSLSETAPLFTVASVLNLLVAITPQRHVESLPSSIAPSSASMLAPVPAAPALLGNVAVPRAATAPNVTRKPANGADAAPPLNGTPANAVPRPLCINGRVAPALLILGCMKCATSALHGALIAGSGGRITAGGCPSGVDCQGFRSYRLKVTNLPSTSLRPPPRPNPAPNPPPPRPLHAPVTSRPLTRPGDPFLLLALIAKQEKHFFDVNRTYALGMKHYLSAYPVCPGAKGRAGSNMGGGSSSGGAAADLNASAAATDLFAKFRSFGANNFGGARGHAFSGSRGQPGAGAKGLPRSWKPPGDRKAGGATAAAAGARGAGEALKEAQTSADRGARAGAWAGGGVGRAGRARQHRRALRLADAASPPLPANGYVVGIDASPSYIRDPYVPPRVAAEYGFPLGGGPSLVDRLLLVAVLREPTSRIFSQVRSAPAGAGRRAADVQRRRGAEALRLALVHSGCCKK